MKRTDKKEKSINKKTKKRKTFWKRSLISMMLVVAVIPVFSGLFPQQQSVQIDPKLAQAYLESRAQEAAAPPEEPSIAGRYEVVKVIDDTSLTVLYEDQKTQVKLIGVRDVNDQTDGHLEMLLSDSYVDLEFDAQEKDDAGNLLAYVYLDDGRFINQELLLNGYGRYVKERDNHKHSDVLQDAEADAKARKAGFWETEE